jgi:hypothetical protein
MLYTILLYLHIASVIASLGPFFVLFPLLRKVRTASADELKIYLPTFTLAIRLSKHSGHILVTTGVLMMWHEHISWLTSWVLITIFILVSSLYFIARAFSPTIRKLATPDHNNRQELVNKLRFNVWLYVVLMLIMLWFMVNKPNFW